LESSTCISFADRDILIYSVAMSPMPLAY